MHTTLTLQDHCVSILLDYLAGGGETALKRAYELGRDALAGRTGVVEMVLVHQEALATILGSMPSVEDGVRAVQTATDILAECLSPFEMIHRGFREAHATLQESERRLRQFIEIIPDVIFTLSPDGTFTSLNPAFERVTGWSREEWLGQPFAPYIHPADLPFAQSIFTRILQNQIIPLFELRVRAKSGEYLIKELTATPEVRDGEVVGVFGIARDITKRRRAEEAVRNLFRGVPIGLARITPEGEILDGNPALVQMFGYSDLQALLPVNVAEFYVNLEDRPHFKLLMERWGVVRDFEVQLRRRDGTIFWVRNNSRAVRDAGGQLLYYEEALEDITEQRQAEIALRHLNEIMEDEAKRIAHALHDEAGQILTPVHLELETIARELPPGVRERLRGVRGLLKHFEEEMRHLSHELRPTVLDDLGLIPALEFLIKGVSKRTGIPISVVGRVEGRLPSSVEIALYRIVQEGLTNVTKYSQASRVWIEVKRTAQLVRCSLRDDGIGFDVQSVLARRGERGIGLVGMRERAEALGGTFQVRSARGRGTELVVTISLER
jgi:PAS domain S-box-containing protein